MQVPGDQNQAGLRKGFTTGACSAAVIKAGWELLIGRCLPEEQSNVVEILFPDCKQHSFTLSDCELRNNSAYAATVKDAGDDPDVTDKALIAATIRAADESEITEKDFLLQHNRAKLILRGGDGVGIATKPGVDVPAGKWAINSVPREMIRNNLIEAGFGKDKGLWLAEISIENGAELAKKTLNPALGIKGGLSILGTTGIVEPKSHAAYIKTVEIVMRGLKREKIDTVILCTGARTLKAVQRDYSDLPDFAFIRIGDFIADSLKLALDMDFQKIIISCMPGKLFKYASGHKYTHAHNAELDLKRLRPVLIELGTSGTAIDKALESVTFRGLLDCFEEEVKKKIINKVGEKALCNISLWAKSTFCEVRCYNYKAELQGVWSSSL